MQDFILMQGNGMGDLKTDLSIEVENVGAFYIAKSGATPVGWPPIRSSNMARFVIGRPWDRSSQNLKSKDLQLADSNDQKWLDKLGGGWIVLEVNRTDVHIAVDALGGIPLYYAKGPVCLAIGTREDWVIKAAGLPNNFDPVSIVDYLMHRNIAFPYALFEGVRQVEPGHVLKLKENELTTVKKWFEPRRIEGFDNFAETAKLLSEELLNSVASITDNYSNIGLLSGGGEDSRAVAGALKELGRAKKTTVITLETPNSREVLIARKIAKAHNMNFVSVPLSAEIYSRVIDKKEIGGFTPNAMQAHAYPLQSILGDKIDKNIPILGGLFADAFFKGGHRPSGKLKALIRYFVSGRKSDINIWTHGRRHTREKEDQFFDSNILEEVAIRWNKHREKFNNLNKEEAEEWMTIWPLSTDGATGTYSFNRRWFNSYEPFMDPYIFQLSMSVPGQWKDSKRWFHQAMHSFFASSKWIPHTDGYLPYMGRGLNTLLMPSVWIKRGIENGIQKAGGLNTLNRGAWPSPTDRANYLSFPDTVFEIVPEMKDILVKSMKADDVWRQMTPNQKLLLKQIIVLKS